MGVGSQLLEECLSQFFLLVIAGQNLRSTGYTLHWLFSHTVELRYSLEGLAFE